MEEKIVVSWRGCSSSSSSGGIFFLDSFGVPAIAKETRDGCMRTIWDVG
jgi:hypothetical protein